MDTSYSLGELEYIFKTYGGDSNQFFEKVKKFIVFLQYRYTGVYDEDLQSICSIKLVDSFRYYTPGKVNIGTWVYSVVRNQISSYLFKRRKRVNEIPDIGLENMPDEGNLGADAHERAVKFNTYLETALNMFNRIDVEDTSAGIVESFEHLSMEHPLTRTLLWDYTKSGLI